jgi:16S rRNA (guanine527-N7)-methyltransferase
VGFGGKNQFFEKKLINYSPEDSVDAYIDLALFWNKTIPLFANSMTKERIKEKIDTIIAASHVYDPYEQVIDLGSGNGILGITLSIINDAPIILVESNKKKVAFLHAAKTMLGTNVSIVHRRIEEIDWSSLITSKTILTAMALAPLTQLIGFLDHVSRETSNHDVKGIFWKGQRCFDEIKEAEKKWSFSYGFVFPSIIEVSSFCLKKK